MFKLLRPERLFSAFPHVKISFIGDLKFDGFFFGLQGISSGTRAYLWSHWSFYNKWRDETFRRTAESIHSDATAFIQASEEYEAKGQQGVKPKPAQFNSTVHQPVEFLMQSPRSLLDTVPPPLLHLLLGIVNRLFDYLDILNRDIGDWFLSQLGVTRTVYRGIAGTDFPGNKCHRILTKADVLLHCPFLQNASPSDAITHTIILLQKSFVAFNTAYHTISAVQLSSSWRSEVDGFRSAYAAFASSYIKIHPPQPHRSSDLLTPKMQCLFVDVPLWIESNDCTLARESEQAFETIHYDFADHLSKYSITKTATPIPTPTPSTPSLSSTPASSIGSRKRNKRKRKQNEDQDFTERKSKAPAIALKRKTPITSGDTKAARRRVLQAVSAYNSQKVIFSTVSTERLLEAAEIFRSEPPPKLFTSDGRSGDTLACLIKEWRSNDGLSVSTIKYK